VAVSQPISRPQAPAVPQPQAPAVPQPQADPADEEFENELGAAFAEAEEASAASSASLLSPAQLRRLKAYSPAGQKLLAERIAASRERLERSPDGHYAIELFITSNSDPARMERFLLRARDSVSLEQVLVIPMLSGTQPRLRVVFGEFENRSQALEAARRLPPRYQAAFRTLPRSFAELRGQI
jgi:septal ring-binding cell division protein DamX